MPSKSRAGDSDLPTPLLRNESRQRADSPHRDGPGRVEKQGSEGRFSGHSRSELDDGRLSAEIERIRRSLDLEGHRQSYPVPVQERTASSVPSRTWKLLILCAIDGLIVWLLALAAYKWSLPDLFTKVRIRCP